MIILLGWCLIDFKFKVREGLDCDEEEKEEEECNNYSEKITDLQNQIDQLSSQVDSLVQQQADLAQDLAGDEPVEVTGTDLDES